MLRSPNNPEWLRHELDDWVEDGVITTAQREILRERYRTDDTIAATPPWGIILFSCAGVVVAALGIILLLAYNWQKIPRVPKLVVLFGALIATQVTAWRWMQRTDWKKYIGAALALFGSMLLGVGIWLIAQVYNVSAHYPEGFLYWGLGVLVMAWVLPSVPQAILATVLLSIWGSSEAWDFHDVSPYPFFAVAVLLGPLVWRTRSALFGGFLLAALALLSFGMIFDYGQGNQVFMFTLALSAASLGLAGLADAYAGEDFPIGRVLRFFGYIGFLGCGYFLSFRSSDSDVSTWSANAEHHPYAALAQIWVAFAVAIAIWLTLARTTFVRHRRRIFPEEWLCPIGLIYIYTALFNINYLHGFALAPIFNLVLVGYSVTWMLRGCRETRLALTIVGSTVLALVLAARYFDLFEDLWTRGLAFLVFGGILFGEAYYFHRTKEASRSGRT